MATPRRRSARLSKSAQQKVWSELLTSRRNQSSASLGPLIIFQRISASSMKLTDVYSTLHLEKCHLLRT